jgi:hypothetical protein
LEQDGDPPTWNPPAPSGASEEDGRRERDAATLGLHREVGLGDCRLIQLDGKCNLFVTPASYRRKRVHDRPRRGVSIEASARSLVHDLDAKPVADERCVGGSLAHGFRDLLEGELERLLRDGDRREDVCAEDTRVEPLEAPNGPEAAAFLRGHPHSRSPVGVDSELICGEPERRITCHEDERIIRNALEPTVQEPGCLTNSASSDVDSRHVRAWRELLL